MSTLRPRIVAEGQLRELKIYAKHLWHDAIKLEKLWMAGRLSKHVQITAEEERIARLAPWQGRAALIASDGLFNFGGGV